MSLGNRVRGAAGRMLALVLALLLFGSAVQSAAGAASALARSLASAAALPGTSASLDNGPALEFPAAALRGAVEGDWREARAPAGGEGPASAIPSGPAPSGPVAASGAAPYGGAQLVAPPRPGRSQRIPTGPPASAG